MIAAWWKAHELEVCIGAVLVGLGVLVWCIETIVDVRAERKKRREDGLL